MSPWRGNDITRSLVKTFWRRLDAIDAIDTLRRCCGLAVNNGAQAGVPVPLEASWQGEMLRSLGASGAKAKRAGGTPAYGSECADRIGCGV